MIAKAKIGKDKRNTIRTISNNSNLLKYIRANKVVTNIPKSIVDFYTEYK